MLYNCKYCTLHKSFPTSAPEQSSFWLLHHTSVRQNEMESNRSGVDWVISLDIAPAFWVTVGQIPIPVLDWCISGLTRTVCALLLQPWKICLYKLIKSHFKCTQFHYQAPKSTFNNSTQMCTNINWLQIPLLFYLFFFNHKMTCHLPAMSVLNSPVMYFVPGFEITIDHPHTDVVKCTQLVRGRGFLLCSLCPLLLFIPPQMWVGRGKKTLLI